MSEAFTFDDVDIDAQTEFDEIPPGTYTCLIEETVCGNAKTGTPELRVQFRIQVGPYKNRVISDWMYFTSKTQEMIATKIVAAGCRPPTGIKTADQGPARVAGIIQGRYVDIIVRPDEYPKGSGEFSNKVKAWKAAPAELQSVPVTNGSSASADDSDIPF